MPDLSICKLHLAPFVIREAKLLLLHFASADRGLAVFPGLIPFAFKRLLKIDTYYIAKAKV